jgi:hypothetical protein
MPIIEIYLHPKFHISLRSLSILPKFISLCVFGKFVGKRTGNFFPSRPISPHRPNPRVEAACSRFPPSPHCLAVPGAPVAHLSAAGHLWAPPVGDSFPKSPLPRTTSARRRNSHCCTQMVALVLRHSAVHVFACHQELSRPFSCSRVVT